MRFVSFVFILMITYPTWPVLLAIVAGESAARMEKLGDEEVHHFMLGGWVNPHREQQTIPQGQTSKPAQIFPHANGQIAPGKAALATFAGAPGATHRARPRSPSRVRNEG